LQQILKSQLNFRDLGGIPTSDGRVVKPGMLFRSGDLASLSDEDIRFLESINLAAIIDLRAQREVDHRPDKKIGTLVDYIHLGIFDAARDEVETLLQKEDAAGLANVLVNDYRRMVNMHHAEFRTFLHTLSVTQSLPVVFHCAAGKDRTGLAATFLLTALGVDLETIRKDYLVTNHYILPYINRIVEKVHARGQNGTLLKPLLEVRNDYLDAALEEIDQRYGGLHRFVTETLRADVPVLQERFLIGG
jgi:protein-tyrosine phosphatase